ncbi:hypothetical protein ACFRAR_04290 [Kitasatospora sp. NPDC056651]|uniref:hypothetical protein n=1 Tax=Kitasatospora sp. NPDC056651 TaxID=3345892 RepID=UPI003694BBC7
MTEPGPGVLFLPDSPGYPLASTVSLPEGHPFAPAGTLSLRLGDLSVTAEGEPGEATVEDLGGGRSRVTYPLAPLALTGRYSLDVRPDPGTGLDSAGDLAPLSTRPASPGLPKPLPAPDDIKEERLDTARAEREKLLESGENGYHLVAAFYEHNEAYADVFDSGRVDDVWKSNGGTDAMAADTHDAVRSDQGKVNDSAKTYANPDPSPKKVSYNENAITQQLTMQEALVHMAERLEEHDPKKAQYQAAAAAAGDFGTRVKADTGNDRTTVNPLTAPQVRDAVKKAANAGRAAAPFDPAPFTDPDGFLERIAVEGPSACPPGLTEADLRDIQRARNACLQADAAAEPASGQPLHQGTCRARIEGATITLETIARGGARTVDWLTVQAPQPDLELDDRDWQGEAGDTARERLTGMHFIRTLLRDALAERVAAAARTGTSPYGHPDLQTGTG